MDNANRGVLVVLGILVLVVLVVPVLGGGMMGAGMMWGGPATAGGWTWGLGMGLGWLVMLAFWGALIVGVVALVRWLGGTGDRTRQPPAESALDVLKRRYAAGELTAEQYRQMKEVLER